MLTVRPATGADAGELLTLQRAAFVTEAQRYGDPLLPPLREDLAGVAAEDAAPQQVRRGVRLVHLVKPRA